MDYIVTCVDCGVTLSANGIGFVKQGYRVSRRSFDGTPIRGTASRPGRGLRCRACVDAAVKARKEVSA